MKTRILSSLAAVALVAGGLFVASRPVAATTTGWCENPDPVSMSAWWSAKELSCSLVLSADYDDGDLSTMGFSGSDAYATSAAWGDEPNSGPVRTDGWTTVWIASDGWTWTDNTVTAGSVPSDETKEPNLPTTYFWYGGSWSRSAIPCSVAEHLTFTSVSTPHGDTSKNQVRTQGPFPCGWNGALIIPPTTFASDPTSSPAESAPALVSATPSPAASAPALVAPTNSGANLWPILTLLFFVLLAVGFFWLRRRRKAPVV